MSLFNDLVRVRKAQRLEKVNVGGYNVRQVAKNGELYRSVHRDYDGRTEWDFHGANAVADRLASQNPGKQFLVTCA